METCWPRRTCGSSTRAASRSASPLADHRPASSAPFFLEPLGSSFMANVPEWQRLSDAVEHVMTTAGLSKEEAKTAVCQAIADGTIRIRVKLREHTTRHLTSNSVLEGKTIEIPTNIKAEDLDWERSRPVKPWLVPRGSYGLPGYWNLEWIELSRTDVTNVLRAAQERGEPARQASSGKGAKRRSRPQFERAKRAIDQLYPQGPPDPSDLPNANLYKRVGQKLKELKLEDVSDDTILRAAGRRRK
jgi:hypothetical protein